MLLVAGNAAAPAIAADWDGWLHVNPRLKECGLAVIYNPLATEIEREIELPLYYTGLTEKALIREQGGKAKSFKLDREFRVRVPVKVPAKGRTWLMLERP